MLATIEGFVIETRQAGKLSFGELYNRLLSPEYHIGLRKGLIPIYIAVVLHVYKREVVVSDMTGQVPLNADTLLQINSKPEQFYISYLDWSPEKENFINILAEAFDDYVVVAEKSINSYDYVVTAMHRWYMSLPRYAKDSKKAPDGGKLRKDYQEMMKLLKQNVNGNELLFEKLPRAFGLNEFHESLADNVTSAKEYYDSYLSKVKKALRDEIKNIFVMQDLAPQIRKMSLSSVIKDWCESIDQSAFEQLFTDGTDKFWFSLFHELGHIVLGHIGQADGIDALDEKNADNWSKDKLIPTEAFEQFKTQKAFAVPSVVAFANNIGIAPGIVVGRLQNEGCIQHNMLNNLKEQYVIAV